jgi:telomere length regulation protein
MGDLLTPLQTTRKVKSSVEKLEVLSPSNGAGLPKEGVRVSSTSRTSASKHSRHTKQDSTAFLQQAYLENATLSETLPDDAREILKGQPDHENLVAVLRYLRFGIEGKHDFNLRASGPKASQILNVLVTVTIPDRWQSLNSKPGSKENKEVRKMFLSCLTCVAGLGALHAEIRRLAALSMPTNSGQSLMLKDAIDVLANVLYPSSFVETVLGDTLTLHPKPAQKHVLWQELSSFVAGGKILSAVAQAFPLAEFTTDEKIAEWLADGTRYIKWLARNICHAAAKVAVAEGEAWPMLTQLLKRGLSLGHSGESSVARLLRSRVAIAHFSQRL